MSEGQATPATTVIVTQRKSNGIAIAGFILALIGLFLSWVPFVGWIVWFLGFLFSFIGVFKSPRGFAIAGLIISVVDIMMLTVLAGLIAAIM